MGLNLILQENCCVFLHTDLLIFRHDDNYNDDNAIPYIYSIITEPPTITELTYQEINNTLTCVSTGSPATIVTWIKDGLTINDANDYTSTQTITDRANSTYSNVLTVNEEIPGSVSGVYNCTVSNVLGFDSRVVVVVGEQ